jgi:hypothetical protein
MEHLEETMRQDYTITMDWDATKFYGTTLDWNYTKGHCTISMPSYVEKHY